MVGVVADAVEADSEHERAVEAFLGDRLQAVIVPDPEQARRGIRWLAGGERRPRHAAAARVGPARAATAAPLHAIAAREPKALGLLSDFYRVSGPDAERIKDALPDAIVVATLEDALELRAREDASPSSRSRARRCAARCSRAAAASRACSRRGAR